MWHAAGPTAIREDNAWAATGVPAGAGPAVRTAEGQRPAPMRRGSPGRAGGHRRDIAQHLDLVPGQLGEGQAERNVGLAVERAVLPARRQLDHGPARVPDRDAPEMVRAMVGFLGARGAARRPLGRRPAGGAEPARPALAASRSFDPSVPGHRPLCVFADRGAVRLVGLPLARRIGEGGIVPHVNATIPRALCSRNFARESSSVPSTGDRTGWFE